MLLFSIWALHVIVGFLHRNWGISLALVLYAWPLIIAIGHGPSACLRFLLRRARLLASPPTPPRRNFSPKEDGFLDVWSGNIATTVLVYPFGTAMIAHGFAESALNGRSHALCAILCALGLFTVVFEGYAAHSLPTRLTWPALRTFSPFDVLRKRSMAFACAVFAAPLTFAAESLYAGIFDGVAIAFLALVSTVCSLALYERSLCMAHCAGIFSFRFSEEKEAASRRIAAATTRPSASRQRSPNKRR